MTTSKLSMMRGEARRIVRAASRAVALAARGHRAGLIAAVVLMIGVGVLSNVPAVVVGEVVDSFADGEGRGSHVALLVLGAIPGAFLVREILQIARKLLIEDACTRAEKRARVAAVRRLLELDLGYFRHQLSGSLQGRLNRSIEGLVRLVKLLFLDLGPTLFVALSALVVALHRDLLVGAVMTAAVPVGLVLVVAQVSSQKGIRVSLLRGKEVMDGTVVELLANIESVRAIDSNDFETARVDDASEDLRRVEMRHHRQMAMFDGAKQLCEGLFHVAVLALSVYFTTTGAFTSGDVIMFSLLFAAVVAPLREVHRIIDEAHESSLRVEDLFEILDRDRDASFHPRPTHGGASDGASRGAALVVRELSYRYPGETMDVLRSTSLNISEGEFVGVCGPAGCGKSTLLKAILRLVHARAGTVELYGRPIEAWTRNELARAVGYVGQRPFLVSGTVLENIAYGLTDTSRGDVVAAAKQANIHDEIMALPGAYDYQVGERGEGLSGGQRQRIAIARVFLRSPTLLLLDEATSALDNLNERLVQAAIERAMRGRTVIAVAHRLSTLRNADRILVMDGGRIVEAGSYVELAGANGLFHRLVSAGERAIFAPVPMNTVGASGASG